MDDQQLKQIIADYSGTYERSIKNLIDFLRAANTMIGWLVALSSGTIIFGFKEIWSKSPEYLGYASLIHAVQILSAVFHRVYNDSHISSLNERIDYVNLQKTFLQNDLSYVRKYPDDKLFFDVYNKIGNLNYLNDIQMTGVKKTVGNLKITKRVYRSSGILVIISFIAIYILFIIVLVK